MKKTNHSFVKRAVLLLTFALLFTIIAATSVLAGDPGETLVFHFDPEKCSVVLECAQLSQDEIPMESDVPVSIPYGAKVTVRVEPKDGYQVADIRDVDRNISIAQPDNSSVYDTGSFITSLRGEILCETRVFDVKFEIDGVLYKPVSGDMAELKGLKYYYKQPAQPTVLPEVFRDGYRFDHWQVIKSDGTEVQKPTKNAEGKYEIDSNIINDDMVATGTIYLHAVFVPITYDVIRNDYAYNATNGSIIKYLGTYKGPMQMDAYINALERMGDDGAESTDPENPYLNYKSYVGYKLYVEGNYPYKHVTIPPTSDDKDNPNTFERWYLPIVYTLEYNLYGGTLPEGAPTTYTYDTYTAIQNPTRRGYTFKGWRVIIDGVQLSETGTGFILGNEGENNANYAAKDEKIVLEAIWEAEKYDITYVWNADEALIQNKSDFIPEGSQFGKFEFDKVTFLPTPIRAGYTFMGWTLTYTNGDATPDNDGLVATEGGYNLDGSLHAQKITLTASWQVESYNVTLEGQEDAPNDYTTTIPGVQFDAPLTIPEGFQVPQREGYTFDGYWSAPNGGGKQYIDKGGNSVCALWDLDGENGSATLYAKWIINQYEITFTPIQKLPAGKEVIIFVYVGNTPIIYTGDAILLNYKTEFYVVVTMPAGFEIVEWNVDSFTSNGTAYTSGMITVGASDITLTAKAKPSAPELGGDVVSIRPISDTEIKILFANATIAELYEVAISLDENEVNLGDGDWISVAQGLDSHVFNNLIPGTNYYVFVRLKATIETDSGIALAPRVLTDYDEYVEFTVGQLNDLLTPEDGGNAKGVIADIIADIDALKQEMPEDFYQQVQQKIDEAIERLVFARFQDSKIAELEKHLEECWNSGSFSQENKVLLNDLCINAVSAISAATSEADVESVFTTAKTAMKAVPVTYLYDASGMMQLTTLLGLGQESGITLSSVQDIKALRRAIADAIAQGKITADSFITVEEATKLLRALDTVAAYNFSLINVQATNGDVFTLRLTIPEALVGSTGLQVAYYNPATGMLELLETTVEGNTIVFKAKQITNFVILADPTVDLTMVIVALGTILLCQIIAIALVLVSRSKAKNSVMHASVALPVFLAIHFLPVDNAELIALGLGAAVILAQVVLMWLLLSSGMIRVFKTKRTESKKQEVTAVVREEDLQEDPYTAFEEEIQEETAEETYPEETLAEEFGDEEVIEEEYAEEAFDEEAFDEELAEELALEQEEEIFDEEVVEEELPTEIEEIYDDEEFIEQAPNPYYSLDEEENVYAFDEEETERVSDENATGAQAEETSYGDDPFDGVFGEAGDQYGVSTDEAESARDQYAYEYGDEDAPYAETADADREETSGQGSVDPYAYVVNDEAEEISEDEEMYRYDE